MQRNYYCVIPSNVMDDDRLTPNSKLMYGLISSLTNQKGYCYANNQFFQAYFKKNKNTIIGWLNQLKEANHIQIEFDPKNSNKRAIKLNLRGSKNRDKGFKKLNCNPKNNKLKIDESPLNKKRLSNEDRINLIFVMSLPIT